MPLFIDDIRAIILSDSFSSAECFFVSHLVSRVISFDTLFFLQTQAFPLRKMHYAECFELYLEVPLCTKLQFFKKFLVNFKVF